MIPGELCDLYNFSLCMAKRVFFVHSESRRFRVCYRFITSVRLLGDPLKTPQSPLFTRLVYPQTVQKCIVSKRVWRRARMKLCKHARTQRARTVQMRLTRAIHNVRTPVQRNTNTKSVKEKINLFFKVITLIIDS